MTAIWLDSREPDPHEADVLRRFWANVPRRHCAYCDKRANFTDGMCGEHTDAPVIGKGDHTS